MDREQMRCMILCGSFHINVNLYEGEMEFFLWTLSLCSVNVVLDSLWTHQKRCRFHSNINETLHLNGLFTLPDPDSDPYSDSDSCTMQKFHIGSDPDSDPLIEMYGIGTDICPRDGYISFPKMGTVTIWETLCTGIRIRTNVNIST